MKTESMKRIQTPLFAALAALLIAPLAARGQDQIPAAINYQGRLTDTLGNPVSSGYYEVGFRIWDDAVQNGAGNLVWGRSFPLHVVTNGLFNVLLTDAGGQITVPATPTNTLLSAFGGPDRYLGLTITVSNGVNISGSEISPRQQLASAPFAIQSQVANTVGPLGVSSTALANGSVVAGKLAANAVISGTIADNAVTSSKIASDAVTSDKLAHGAVVDGKIAAGAVTTATLTNGAVTSTKLNIDGDVHFNGHVLYLNPGNSHGLEHNGNAFAGNSLDGPVLWGYQGGLLGTVNGGNKVALQWENDQSVTLNGALDIPGSDVHIKNGRVGIGTDTPLASLDVAGGVVSASNDGNGKKMIHGDSGVSSSSSRSDVVAYFEGSIVAKEAVASYGTPTFSDERAKRVLGPSSGKDDLKTLDQIRITNYRYIHRPGVKSRVEKKVIAQQVEKVFPQAVSRMENVIPSIYTNATQIAYDASSRKLTITLARPHGLMIGDHVDLYTDVGTLTRTPVVATPSRETFSVRCKREPHRAFVFGKWVNDFRTVDYAAISMLNVSATQELHRRLEASEQAIATLQQQNSALEQRLARMEAREREQQDQFSALEKLVRDSRKSVQEASLH